MVSSHLPSLKDNIPLNSFITIGTISVDTFKPLFDTNLALPITIKSGSFSDFVRVYLYTTGEIKVYRYKGTVGSGSAINTQGGITYMAAK